MTTACAMYSEAKKALNASEPERVICRTNENEKLYDYLDECFSKKKTCSIYVNGQPGTGKTLTVTHLLEEFKESYKFKQILVNCMSLKNIQSLYKIMSQELPLSSLNNSNAGTPSKRSTKDGMAKTAENAIVTQKQPIVLVLDEIDQIETSVKSTTDLYKIFEWPFLKSSKLILIGIANSLDFTDRILPRLELKPECKPKIVNFTPYSKEDIVNIVKDRLKSVTETNANQPIIEDRAINLCATKVAATNGDIRKVLDICRRAVDLIEAQFKTGSADKSGPLKPVGIPLMMRVFNEINPMTSAKFDKGNMPLTQKVLLCTLLLCNKESRVKDVILSKLYDRFNKICDTKIESESEFLHLCTLVQDNGLVDVKKAKEVRNYKVSLKIDETEVREKLEDETFIGNILDKYMNK